MPDAADALRTELRRALGTPAVEVVVTGTPFLRSPLAASDLATTAATAFGEALAGFVGQGVHRVRVDRALADAWNGLHVRPLGWAPPSPWDPLSAAFRTADDSWIRTHANAPHHRRALLDALGITEADVPVERVRRTIRARGADELETAIVAGGGAAAALRSPDGWDASAAGRAVSTEPVIASDTTAPWDGRTRHAPTAGAPLTGLRVLDLTRVIAGPACTQLLAGLGADVLRVDPPDWDEPAVLPLVMWEKRSVRLDARTTAGLDHLRALLSEADVLVHGYRAGALDRLGIGPDERARLRPGLVEVAERAYGWTGPWAERRGFDSVVQFSTGIASIGMTAAGADAPVSLPVQALDWTTGTLAAAAALAGLSRRATSGTGSTWRLSLARTALALRRLGTTDGDDTSSSKNKNGNGSSTGVGAGVPSEVPAARRDTADGPVVLAGSPVSLDTTSGTVTPGFRTVRTRLGGDDPIWR